MPMRVIYLFLVLVRSAPHDQIRAPPDPLANAPRVDAEHDARHRADQPERVAVLVARRLAGLLAQRRRVPPEQRPALDERVPLLDGLVRAEPPHDALATGHPD